MAKQIVLLALWLAAPVSAQQAPQSPDSAGTVVVTAMRLDVTERALKACIARNCPPDEEVAAALAHAENQFVAGDYRQARHTLHGTIGRVDRQAKAYPVPVANIWRAESRISAHLGERVSMQSAQFEAIDALKSGLAKTDNRVLLQRLRVADTFIKRGELDMGRAGYRTVIKQAREMNDPVMEGTALLRILLFDAALAGLPADALHPSARYGSTAANYRQAKKSVAELLSTTSPVLAGFRDAARLIDARLEATRGDMSGIEAIAADYGRKGSTAAVLLYEPLMDDRGTFFDPQRARLLGEQDFVGQWVDLTFLVGRDGRVKEVEVLRQSPTLRNDWVAPVLANIGTRRYAPIALPAELDGMRRVERYTMTAWIGGATGSRMRVRSGSPRLEMLDLTADTPKTASGVSPAAPAPAG